MKENYWEYEDVVRIYSPPLCTEIFGKMIAMADTILLGDNKTAISEFVSMWASPYSIGTNSSVGNFAFWNLNFPYDLQSKNW